jgi:sigma-E factor negative regulatory protein RseC
MKEISEGVIVEDNGKTAKVKLSRHSECSSCGLCPGEDAIIIDAYNKAGAAIGQRVTVEITNQNVLKAAFIVYILPLLAVGAGIILGLWLSGLLKISSVLCASIGGIVLLLASIFSIKYFDRSLQLKEDLPIIIKKV